MTKKNSKFNPFSQIQTDSVIRKRNVVSSRIDKAGQWSQNLLPQGQGQVAVEADINHKPLLLMVATIVVVFGIFGLRLMNLQIVNGQRYAGLAEGNRMRSKVTYAQRGRILDRYGVVVASNQASSQLVAYPYLLPKSADKRQTIYQQLSDHIGIGAAEIKHQVEAKGLSSIQPILVKENLNYEQALVIEQKLPNLAGFALDAIPVRSYASGSGMGNNLGYVGRVDEHELKQNPHLLAIDFIGKDGIEFSYDRVLRGQNGVVNTEVDASGRPIRVLSERPTKSGQDITLTIDYELQKRFASAIAEQMQRAGVKRAAGVAIDPRTGEVLASVSLPDYDNNLFSGGISAAAYQQLLSNKLEPLHNKVIGGVYPSGSVIKPLHLAGALQEKVVTEQTVIVDRGKIVIPSEYDPSVEYTFFGYDHAGLGPMNARRALAMSSDIYFYTTGGGFQGFKGLGVDRLTDYYRKFGLGSLTGIDLPGEEPGRVPTPEWKKQTKGEDWFVGDTYNISIGQGDILTSPLQMAVSTSAAVNGGKILQPFMFKQTLDGKNVTQTKVVRENFIDPKYWQVIREGMRQVIGGTTATSTFANVPVKVAGKSGTAETDPTTGRKSHAWYTAFAPYETPEIMFAVILEEGEGGSQFSAPAISKAMQWYFGEGKNR